MIPMLDLKRLHAPIKDELLLAVEEILAGSNFIMGPLVSKFEEELAKYVGAKNAIGVSSGTDGLLVSMMALDVKPGNEVITTPYTFFATAGCISRLGAKPVFVDIDINTFNIDPIGISDAITEHTVGIIPVHLFGLCQDLNPILEIAREKNLWVLEDAAQAIAAEYRGKKAGTIGTVGIYSFFPAKNLGALGDGGAVVTNDDALADRIRSLRTHGSKTKYSHGEVGGNFRLDAIQAAFLSIKLPHLKAWEEGRRRVASKYKEDLESIESLILPEEPAGYRHVFNQYVIRSSKRDALKKALDRAQISSAIYYPAPLHLQKCFQYLGYRTGDFKASEQASKECLALPIDPLLARDEIDIIVSAVKTCPLHP